MHKSMQGAHEGYAVLLEEVDELWDEVKKNPRKDPACIARRRTEAIQIAAMAMRFVLDVCDSGTAHDNQPLGIARTSTY